MFNYLKTQATADKMIAQFGFEAILRRADGDRTCNVVRTDYSPRERDGDMIQFTDRRYLIAAGGLTIPPDPEEDRLVVGNEELRIVTSRPIQPEKVPVLYEVQARL